MTALLSPVVLFFVLGAAAALVRSDLSVPEPIAKGLTIYLMMAIGLKGGVEVAAQGPSFDFLSAALLGVGLSFLIPIPVYGALRTFGRLDRVNAGAVSAHYGSVSVVTFVTGAEILTGLGMPAAGFMVAVLALMETPAIVTGLLLARSGKAASATSPGSAGGLLHETLLNGGRLSDGGAGVRSRVPRSAMRIPSGDGALGGASTNANAVANLAPCTGRPRGSDNQRLRRRRWRNTR